MQFPAQSHKEDKDAETADERHTPCSFCGSMHLDIRFYFKETYQLMTPFGELQSLWGGCVTSL